MSDFELIPKADEAASPGRTSWGCRGKWGCRYNVASEFAAVVFASLLWIGFSSGALSASLVGEKLVPQRSVSRQFVVYGKQKSLVGYAMQRSDSLATHWNRLFSFSTAGPKPIIIYLLEDPTRRLSGKQTAFDAKLFLTDANYLKVQLDVLDWRQVRTFKFDRRILQALALRNAYTTVPPTVGSLYRQPPDWVVDAVLRDVLDREKGDLTRLHAAALVTAHNLDVQAFLAEKPEQMDAISRATYQIKARALLQSLMDLPQGKAGLRAFLLNPNLWDGSAASLLTCFPTLRGDTNRLTKIWVLNLARFPSTQKILPLGMEETAQRLNAILLISLPEGVKSPRNKMLSGAQVISLIATEPKYQDLLRGKAQDLLILSLRAHPMYRPLINEYRKIVETLLWHPRKNLNARIEKAEKSRWALNERCEVIENCMNWFESAAATASEQPFQSLLENDQRRRASTWRSDAISKALDAAEAGGW